METKKRFRNSKGFTLIELLLVVGIIGVLLAIIIPKAIRANVNAKYGIVAKNCAELKSFAVQWAEKSIRAQDESASTATLGDYYASLAGQSAGLVGGASQQWIAVAGNNNWNMGTPPVQGGTTTIAVLGRMQQGVAAPPEDTVEDIIPPEKALKNPFNGVNVFRSPNLPTTQGRPVTGAVALGFQQETIAAGGFYYFAFAFQGTDSTTFALANDITDFHAGSGLQDIPALRNGELFARIR